MKHLIFIIFLYTNFSFAGNLLIPTCDLNINQAEFRKLSDQQLNDKTNTYLHRRDHCDAASALLEMYGRSQSLVNKSTIRKNLFLSLNKGRFLNEYTSLILGLGKDLDHLESEEALENLVLLYSHFITHRGTNPSSQFYVGSRHLNLLDEAEVQFRFFISNFPNNSSVKKIKKSLKTVYDRKIYNSLEYINFYAAKEGFRGEIEGRELFKLLKLLDRGYESKYFQQGLSLIAREKTHGAFSPVFLAKLNLILDLYFINKLNPVDISHELKGLIKNESSELSSMPFINSGNNEGSNQLNDFLTQKGEDKSVFFPLNKDFKFTPTKMLVSLGVVGILMVFDEPIMNFVQRNKEAGIMDEIANYGNHFGEISGLMPLVLGTLGYGLVFDSNKSKNAAISSIGAAVLGQLVVETLKSATHRSRPEAGVGPFDFKGFGLGSDNTSFPSGHSAAAWSVASVFAEEFGDEYKWAPAAAYGLAAITSYSRMNKNKHWASDVVMGALVGYVAGKIFHKFYRETFKNRTENISVTPIIGSMNGLKVVISEKMYADLKKYPLDILYRYQKSVLLNASRDLKYLDNIYIDVYLD